MADDTTPPTPEAARAYLAEIGRRGGRHPKKRHPREAEIVAAYLAADPPLSYCAIAAQFGAHRNTVMRAVAAQVAEPAARRVIAGENDLAVARECRLDVRTLRAAVKRIRAAEEAAQNG